MRYSHAVEPNKNPKFNLNVLAEEIIEKHLQEEKDQECFSIVKNHNQNPSSWASKRNSLRCYDQSKENLQFRGLHDTDYEYSIEDSLSPKSFTNKKV